MRVGPPRKLSEFEDLTAAEKQLLAEYASGEGVVIGDGKRPGASAGPERQIRANLIRYLLLGGCDELKEKVHEKGVAISGARVTGTLDLEGCESKIDLLLENCHFDKRPNLLSARLASVILNLSALPGLQGDRLFTTGSVLLRGAVAKGEVWLLGAQIGGNFECTEAKLETRGKEIAALNADRLSVTGNVFLRRAEVTGAVKLLGAQIGGALDCDAAKLEARGIESAALNADRLSVTGSVSLRKAEVIGGIRLTGAQIGGNLECEGAQLTAHEGGQEGLGTALAIDDAKIAGGFFLREGASIKGTLDMASAEIGSLPDDPTCWPGPGNLILNRCRYGAFTGIGVTAQERICWLALQDPTQFGRDFWPQPWEQCAKVLREMGHRSDARLVLIDKEERQRAWNRSKLPRWRKPFAWFKDQLLAKTIGYGHRPLMAFRWLAILWLIGLGLFWAAHDADAFKPNNSFVLRAPEWVLCAVPSDQRIYLPSTARIQNGRANADEPQVACFQRQAEAQSYPKFNPFTYSADTLFPLVDIEMQSHWLPDENAGPVGQIARYYLWLQIAFGWALSLLAVAGFSGLVRND